MPVFAKVIRRIKAVGSVGQKRRSTMLAIHTGAILRKAEVNSDVTIGNVYLAIERLFPSDFTTSIVRRALGHSTLTRLAIKDTIGLRHTVPTGKHFNKRVMTNRISNIKHVTGVQGSSATV